VCGITVADQAVMDDFIETGVSACRWQRPEPRTPSCTELRAEIAGLRQNSEAKPMPVKAPAKKPTRWQRIKSHFRKPAQ